jgi:hypothetical protein
VGFRPDLDFAGYWLYCGDVPVVHLVPRGSAIAVRHRIPGPSTTSRSWHPIFRGSSRRSTRKASATAKTTSQARRLTSCSSRTTTT